jgi:hypothetical protein
MPAEASHFPLAEQAGDAMEIDANRRLLNRYRYIEQQGIRVLAGWLPKVALYELKCEMGRVIWEDTQHVNSLYLRLREIQSPAFQKPADEALIRLMGEMLHAPNELALAAAFWRVLKPELSLALEAHETATFPNSDAPSVYAIEHIVYDERAQVARMETLLAGWAAEGRFGPAISEWETYVRALLREAGGIGGHDVRPPLPVPDSPVRRVFVPPVEAVRDERFTNLGVVASLFGELPSEDDYEKHTSWEFERYSTELLAAETIGLVMYLVTGMPWEFYYDLARHLYDEVRHARMGYEWMRLHGADPFQAPQSLAIFKWRSQYPPIVQYTMLTMGNEANVFPYRHRRLEAHKNLGDRLSEQFVRYDMADETQHVRFGKRWVPELVKASGDVRPPEQFIADVLKIWNAQYVNSTLPIQAE